MENIVNIVFGILLLFLQLGIFPGNGSRLPVQNPPRSTVATQVPGAYSLPVNSLQSDKKITMFVASDIHYLAGELNDNGEAFQAYLASGDGGQLNYAEEIVNAFARDVIQEKPDFVIISGDLTNNGEKQSHVKLAEKLRHIAKMSGTRILVIPGNHDLMNPWARGFKGKAQYLTDTISRNDFKKIYDEFGYGRAVSADKSSLSYLATLSDNLWLLMLDTSEYWYNRAMGKPVTQGMVGDKTLDWIKECGARAKAKGARLVTVMHHNLAQHSSLFSKEFTIDNSEKIAKAFEKLEINLVLSGHMHIQDIQSVAGENGRIFDIATSALIIYPQQYGVLQYSPGEGFNYRTSRVDIEAWAKAEGIHDNNLLNFTACSRDFFAGISFNKTYRSLLATGGYSAEQAKLMADTMSLINLNYFAGTVGSIKAEIVQSPGYRLWTGSEKAQFLGKYVLGMISDGDKDNNHLQIPERAAAK
jgi:predicted MPP superfamily phosphohydrolase